MNPRAITADEAIALLPDEQDAIHTMVQTGPTVNGMTISRSSVEERIRVASLILVSTGLARRMQHGLCVYEEMPEDMVKEMEWATGETYSRPLTRPMFVATDKAKLDAFDPPPEGDVAAS